MATKTIALYTMIAAGCGVAVATATFGPSGHPPNERPQAPGSSVDDERMVSKSSKRTLGVSKPKELELPDSRGLRPTFNSASLEFRIEGEKEAVDLVEKVWNIPEQAVVTNEMRLAAMAVIAKVVAHGFSTDEILQSQFCSKYCSPEKGVEAVLEATMEQLVCSGLHGYHDDPSVTSNLSHYDDGEPTTDFPGFVEGSEGGLRDNGAHIRGDFDLIPGGSVPGPTGGGGDNGVVDNDEGFTFGQDALAAAMDALERALSVGEGDPGIYQGSWTANAYGDEERSLQTLRVVTDMAFALTVYNAGSVLFCGVEETPVFVYELDVSATPDDIEILQAALDEALEQKPGSRRVSRTDLEEVHAVLLEEDVQLEAIRVSYRDGLQTQPTTLNGNAAQRFLGSCTDSLIDP